MALSSKTKTWTPVTVHEVVIAWLRAERDKKGSGAVASSPGRSVLLEQPNPADADENRERLRMLYEYRRGFISEIPPDTAWYKVISLTDLELDELRVVNFGQWIHKDAGNDLRVVARTRALPLEQPWTDWQPPILFGHSCEGPFTIIEGNHRLAAYAGSGASGLDIPAFVGLSPTKCHWNMFDDVPPLMRDLTRHDTLYTATLVLMRLGVSDGAIVDGLVSVGAHPEVARAALALAKAQ